MGVTNAISITSYTRTGETRKRLHVNVYHEPNGQQMASIRVGDVYLYLTADDALTLGQGIVSAIYEAAK